VAAAADIAEKNSCAGIVAAGTKLRQSQSRPSQNYTCGGQESRPLPSIAPIHLPSKATDLAILPLPSFSEALRSASRSFLRRLNSPLSQRWQKLHVIPFMQPSGFQFQAQGLHVFVEWPKAPMEETPSGSSRAASRPEPCLRGSSPIVALASFKSDVPLAHVDEDWAEDRALDMVYDEPCSSEVICDDHCARPLCSKLCGELGFDDDWSLGMLCLDTEPSPCTGSEWLLW